VAEVPAAMLASGAPVSPSCGRWTADVGLEPRSITDLCVGGPVHLEVQCTTGPTAGGHAVIILERSAAFVQLALGKSSNTRVVASLAVHIWYTCGAPGRRSMRSRTSLRKQPSGMANRWFSAKERRTPGRGEATGGLLCVALDVEVRELLEQAGTSCAR
jgi:hypothetical protein